MLRSVSSVNGSQNWKYGNSGTFTVHFMDPLLLHGGILLILCTQLVICNGLYSQKIKIFLWELVVPTCRTVFSVEDLMFPFFLFGVLCEVLQSHPVILLDSVVLSLRIGINSHSCWLKHDSSREHFLYVIHGFSGTSFSRVQKLSGWLLMVPYFGLFSRVQKLSGWLLMVYFG